ncbi:MAG: glycosyltransferase family 39 protein, partial [Bacteroidota bacterium]
GFCLGNDEAYYYTYALYPALSHFDHPPMVGWVIQLFSFNLYFGSEFFIRLAAVVAGTLNTWLVFRIGKQLRDELTGWYAALLYTASVYGFIITGVFILPDAPQTVFWLAALLFLLQAFAGETDSRHEKKFLLASVFIGLALLSKYTSAFLWLGMMLYILIYDRTWLKRRVFYLGHLLMLLLFMPVIIWNQQNGFVSFLFHSGRVEPVATVLTPDYFLTEILGEALYTNPLNLVLIGISVFVFFKRRSFFRNKEVGLLICSALPVILIFLLVSVSRRTLPHWNAAGYLSLIPLAALWIRGRRDGVFPTVIKASLAFGIVLIVISTAQILTGFVPLDRYIKTKGGKGSADYSLEVYGWRQLREGFIPLADTYEKAGLMPAAAPIVSYRWFPAANYSYYAARGTNRIVMAAGDTSEIHKYAWINSAEGGFRLNSDAWYITSSRDFRHPRALPGLYYRQVFPPDTISVMRMGKPAYYFYVYRMKNLQSKR